MPFQNKGKIVSLSSRLLFIERAVLALTASLIANVEPRQDSGFITLETPSVQSKLTVLLRRVWVCNVDVQKSSMPLLYILMHKGWAPKNSAGSSYLFIYVLRVKCSHTFGCSGTQWCCICRHSYAIFCSPVLPDHTWTTVRRERMQATSIITSVETMFSETPLCEKQAEIPTCHRTTDHVNHCTPIVSYFLYMFFWHCYSVIQSIGETP